LSESANVASLLEWTGGQLLCGRADASFTGTVIDSRMVSAGDLFVAIVGPNHDAHRFVDTVLNQGAAGALVQSERLESSTASSGGFLVHVRDTGEALAGLARGHRSGFSGPLIGITGSNGKTTTKELCAGILQNLGPTLATQGNLNNHFGVPLTLLRREAEDHYAVVEMGMNHRGEIAHLADIARPTIGVLTNVGTAHIEFLGSRENIALEKGDLLAALPESGVAVVGRDDPLAYAQARRSPARTLSFGRDPSADLRASGPRFFDEGRWSFQLESPFGRGEILVQGLAETIIENALAAAGGAFAAGADFEAVARGLAQHSGVPGRMQSRSFPNDVLVIDDSYNANPQSVRNALESLARLPTQGARLAVLGQMGELGDSAEAAHAELGRLAAELHLEGLFLTGDHAMRSADAAKASGMGADRIFIGADHAAIAAALLARVGRGDRILVKGSRAARMERVIELLAQEWSR
jgi:UDP-N-acetylmuramoyl-tripeptide--D-alanyl-D-alanine ligase